MDGLYIVLISLHGLIRGQHMELGRDADTGGQVKYVVELARAIATHPAVHRVELLTRLVQDPKVRAIVGVPVRLLRQGRKRHCTAGTWLISVSWLTNVQAEEIPYSSVKTQHICIAFALQAR